jgi:hypothetical protein
MGGTNWNGRVADHINKIKYYPQEVVSRVASKLSLPLVASMGGIGNSTTGLVLGGIDAFNVLGRIGHLYNHSTDAVSVITNFLARNRFAPHGGLSSKFAGYILGGSELPFRGPVLTSVEKVTYSSNMTATSAIASSLGWAHVVSAKFGNSSKGYIAGGGHNANSNNDLEFASKVITRFLYAGETSAPLSQQLPNQLTCSFGGGSSSSGYAFTGWVDDTFSSLTNSGIFKLSYSNEASSLIEQRLLEEAWDTGTVSDYSPSFY